MQTMMQVVGKETDNSDYDKYLNIKDEDEEAAKWQAASHDNAHTVTSHAVHEMNMFSTSSKSMFSTTSAVSNLSATSFMGSVAEGWDIESEYKSRMRLQKSANLISPEVYHHIQINHNPAPTHAQTPTPMLTPFNSFFYP